MLAKREKRDRMNGDGSDFPEKRSVFAPGGGLALAQFCVKRGRGDPRTRRCECSRRRK